jgi:undecaprenyl diphosphate synthase
MEAALPQHIAIIPDGNRRWAKQQGLKVVFGHRAGAQTTENILKEVLRLKIPYLTFWGCSVDNLVKRDPEEIKFLLALFEEHFTKLIENEAIHREQVNIQAYGLWRDYFTPGAKKATETMIERTASYSRYHLTFLLGYSGVLEMTAACENLRTTPPSTPITPEAIKQNLYTRDLPPVDLAIRTGGEPHLSSGFMMWDMADAHLYFTETLWPDFSLPEFSKALASFSSAERRRGK